MWLGLQLISAQRNAFVLVVIGAAAVVACAVLCELLVRTGASTRSTLPAHVLMLCAAVLAGCVAAIAAILVDQLP